MHDLSSVQRDLLVVLSELGESTGVGVKREFEREASRHLSAGRLYSNLDALAEKGLIEKRRDDGRTNAYAISGRGQREVRAHLSWQRQYLDAARGPR